MDVEVVVQTPAVFWQKHQMNPDNMAGLISQVVMLAKRIVMDIEEVLQTPAEL